MYQRLTLGAVCVVPQHNGVVSYPINITSTTTSSERDFQHFRTLWSQSFSTVRNTGDESSTPIFATTTGISMLSPTLAPVTPTHTEAKSATSRLSNIDVPFVNDSNIYKDKGKDIDENIRSPLLPEGLKWIPSLIGFSCTLTMGWYRPSQEPASFWTIANLVAAAAILPFHNPSTADILGNAVKGFAVASNVLHFQTTVGVNSRPVIGLVITIVVFFLLYSQRRNLIGDGPEDRGLRVVAPWICAPIAIVTVSELFKLLQWLKSIGSAMMRSICDTIADRPRILEHGLHC